MCYLYLMAEKKVFFKTAIWPSAKPDVFKSLVGKPTVYLKDKTMFKIYDQNIKYLVALFFTSFDL